MSRYRILNMADVDLFPDILAPLNEIADIDTLPPHQSLLKTNIGAYDAYIATLKARVDADVLANAAKLKVIATPSTGLDHIDIDLCRHKGIAVLSLKEETEFLDSVTATAELAWGLLLSVARKIPWAHQASCKGQWGRDKFRGVQLSGKTIGILGLGRLGRIVAQYAHAFRMKVIACNTADVIPPDYVTMVNFGELLEQSDVLTIHVHLTQENRNLIDETALRKMKKDAILVNTSRGGIIDEPALLRALEEKWISAAAADVICGEWDKNLSSHLLVKYAANHDNMLITPHVGGVTFESQKMTLEFIVNKLKQFLTDRHNA